MMTRIQSILRAMAAVSPIAGVGLGLLAFRVDLTLILLALAGTATFVSSGWAVFSVQARNPMRFAVVISITAFLAAILWIILRGIPILAYFSLGVLMLASWVLWTVSMIPPPRVTSLGLALAGSLAVIFFSLAVRQVSGTPDLVVVAVSGLQEALVVYSSIRISRYRTPTPQPRD